MSRITRVKVRCDRNTVLSIKTFAVYSLLNTHVQLNRRACRETAHPVPGKISDQAQATPWRLSYALYILFVIHIWSFGPAVAVEKPSVTALVPSSAQCFSTSIMFSQFMTIIALIKFPVIRQRPPLQYMAIKNHTYLSNRNAHHHTCSLAHSY